ncbi:glycosyltransferase family A protein [Acaryochloris sp. CCMEE 5410]|uniref:glycosyltransferase family 2 protein n=1 Tax=Acaryochloris sp. CCMEE 5410 TaxID=310037 RepID=UPI00024838BE|nr:glycosyltransferase family A protein [Acaryochloris sp. CCMEE 5410]KAI9132390.1 glycosyltransferase [Acaryochloris sp. CCMEE 5410]
MVSVSVIIPTRNRASLVSVAVESVLQQTWTSLEVIVVIDGPDSDTEAVLELISDSRLQVITLPSSGGASRARNRGVQAARGEWVAFLDDDDEWYPRKLETQLLLVQTLTCRYPIAACRMTIKTPRGEFVVPRRFPKLGEPISNYLFLRPDFIQGDGFFLTSMLLTRRQLMLDVPFQEGLKMCQDLDWLLRATQVQGAELHFAEAALGTWNLDEHRSRIGTSGCWTTLFEWIQSCRQRNLVTPEAYGAFLMTQVNSLASASKDWQGLKTILMSAWTYGNASFKSYALLISMWVIPPTPRRILRDAILQNPFSRLRIRHER